MVAPFRKKIAVVTTSFPEHAGDPSGHFVAAEVHTLAADHDVRVFVPRGRPFGWPGLLPQLSGSPLTTGPRLAAKLFALRRALTRAAPFDHAIAHFLPCAALCRGIAPTLEIVIHGTDLRVVAALPAPLAQRALTRLLAPATRIRTVSTELADLLLAHLPPAERHGVEARLAVAPSPITMPDVGAAAASLRARYAGKRLAVCVGRLIPAKGVDRVIEHVAQNEPHTTLVVVGDGPERERLEAHARRRSLATTFVGKLPRCEALAWIGAADVVFHGSRSEGACTVMREANELGTPFLAL